MFCPNCGNKFSGDGNFCDSCRKRINEGAEILNASKFCPFCKTKISINHEECPNCRRLLIEKISPGIKQQINEMRKPYRLNLFKLFIKNINFRKLIFNRYVAILIGVILLVWIASGDESHNSGGTEVPLPAPIQQVSDNVVEFIPSTPAVSLANGTILKKNSTYLRGYGELQIKNGTSLDAVAKLIRGGSSILTVYIKANSSYTMTDISDGVYWLAFAQGLDWDSGTQKFRGNIQGSVFDETFDFTTTEDSQYYHYSTFEVTLNPVIGGTAKTSNIDLTQFNAY